MSLHNAMAAISSEMVTPQKKYVTASELLKKGLTEVPKLIDPIFQKVGIAAVVGSSDTGKSAFLRQLALSVATQQTDFLGFKINAKHHKSIYVSSEDDESSIASLLYKYNTEFKLNNEQYTGLRFVFDTQNLQNTLDAMLTEEKADVVVIDAFADLYIGQMNEGNRVRQFLNEFSQLAQVHQCLIVFLHHVGKRTEEQAPNKGNIIGSQSFEAKMRMVIELRKDNNHPQNRHLCIVKGNYLREEYKNSSYVLNFNNNMVFQNTGKRMPFENLVKGASKDDEKTRQNKQLKELINKGMSQNKAAAALGMSKGQASKILSEYKEQEEHKNIGIDEDIDVSSFQLHNHVETETLPKVA